MVAKALLLSGAITLVLGASPAAGYATGGTSAPRTEPPVATTGGVSVYTRAPKAPARMKRKPARRRTPAKPKPIVNTAGFTFPILGAHNYGGADARFGAARSGHVHQGQDIMAASGTPLVAVTRATVLYKAFQASGAGHYVVLHGTDGRDYVYMHLLAPATVAKGASVTAGQQIGQVGSTGRSTAAHLHFEIWVGGWYVKDGAPIDPLPELQAWDRK